MTATATTIMTTITTVEVGVVGSGGSAISWRLGGHRSLRLGGCNTGGEKRSFI
jgi:hypothetical protein